MKVSQLLVLTCKCLSNLVDQFIRQHEQEQLRKLKADVLDLLPPLSNVILTSYLPRSTRKRLNSCVCLSLTSNSNISPF